MDSVSKDQAFFVIYFALSTVLTWWFVAASPLYISQEQMILSTAVAGGKWGIQILSALVFLKEKKWAFLKNIGFVCFVGSCILLPYILFSISKIADDSNFFLGSLAASVAVMVVLYFRAIRISTVSLQWWFFWLVCLAMAISLQLTVVF
jgi:hypothetical protein